MDKPVDIEGTSGRAHHKPGDVRPAWPDDWRKENSFKTIVSGVFSALEYATGWYYYLFGNVSSFRFLLQLSAVMLFAFGVYGVTIDIEKRQIERGVREATLFSLIARTHALPDGKGARALRSSVEALARDGVAMKEINLSGADFRGAVLVGADFRRADLSGAIFVEADLSGADFYGADLSGAIFIRADLTDAILCETDLSNADLVGARLHNADLDRANLQGAELLVADFSNAEMDGAIVVSANATYSNFSGATLSHASFDDTELQGAVFEGADFAGARFVGSYDLSDSQIEGACMSSNTPPVLPDHLEWTGRRC